MLKRKKRKIAKWLASLVAGLAATALWPWFGKSGISAAQQAPANAESGKPNVLVVVMDDVGYSDLGCYGGEIETPNIDSIARDGLRYIRFDTNAICSA
ncbi:MAG TPA: sulfatase-like hydrolase/transferase, partial [Candidatus Acidoferrales bacterium]|nr:sulfatase-like hydrolase/transferase [Candidatus Acidoferrales bacterium]